MSGRQSPGEIILINARILRELQWLKAHIQSNNGGTTVQPLMDWGGINNVINYIDACPSDVGIWIPSLHQGFQTKIGPQEVHKIGRGDIMDLESFAIVAALEYGARCFRPTNLAIFSDSQSSIDMFDSLNTKDEHRNNLVTAFVNITKEFGILCQVFHISGQDNEISDALSWFENHRLQRVNMTTQQLEMIMLFNMLANLWIT
jgi:ribonuclease HI